MSDYTITLNDDEIKIILGLLNESIEYYMDYLSSQGSGVDEEGEREIHLQLKLKRIVEDTSE